MTTETIHASSVAIGGHGVLIMGRSGSGKSDLALRLIDRGATLISDDYTMIEPKDGALIARPVATIAGRIEVREIGILSLPLVGEAVVALVVILDEPTERLPAAGVTRRIAGLDIPAAVIDARSPSAPIKVELALKRLTGGA